MPEGFTEKNTDPPGDVVRQQEEQRGGEARGHPDAEDVEVGRVLHPLAALHRGHALTSVHCPALTMWKM